MQLNQINSIYKAPVIQTWSPECLTEQDKNNTDRKCRRDQTAVNRNVGVRSKSYNDEASQTITAEQQQSDKSDTVPRKIKKKKTEKLLCNKIDVKFASRHK